MHFEYEFLGVKFVAENLVTKDFSKYKTFVETSFSDSRTVLPNNFNFAAFG